MDRRQFIGSTAATTVLAIAPTAPGDAQAAGRAHRGAGAKITFDPAHARNPELGRRLPLNRDRALAVLEELKLDGLIALRPHNVYYLTNTTTTLTAFGEEYPAFATFARDPAQPSFLVCSNGNTWETSNGEREVPPVITFSGAANWQDYVNASPEQLRIEPESAGRKRRGNAVRAGVELTAREAGWKRAQETYNPESAASPEWALVRALRQSGLARGRIAVDDMRVAWMLQRIGFDGVTIVPGDNVFRRIRHVKAPQEIELLRVAQRITQDSALAAAHALEPGMTFHEFRQRLFAEAAARGGDPGFVLLGVTQGLLPDGVVKPGRSYMLDCSTHFKKYQGDFARTICIGEPSKEAMARFKAQQAGREAAFAIIKAGVPFSTVERTAREAMVKSGMPPELPTIVLHSIGLQHGDDPSRLDVPFAVRGDLVLEEDMTVTLDLPYLEIGWGGGHNEDMLRITRNGYVLMNDPGEALVVV
jgi:Xaa-Pro aminopeptidase